MNEEENFARFYVADDRLRDLRNEILALSESAKVLGQTALAETLFKWQDTLKRAALDMLLAFEYDETTEVEQ